MKMELLVFHCEHCGIQISTINLEKNLSCIQSTLHEKDEEETVMSHDDIKRHVKVEVQEFLCQSCANKFTDCCDLEADAYDKERQHLKETKKEEYEAFRNKCSLARPLEKHETMKDFKEVNFTIDQNIYVNNKHDKEETVMFTVDEQHVDVEEKEYECKSLALPLEDKKDETVHESKELVRIDQNIHFNTHVNEEKEKISKKNELMKIQNIQLKDKSGSVHLKNAGSDVNADAEERQYLKEHKKEVIQEYEEFGNKDNLKKSSVERDEPVDRYQEFLILTLDQNINLDNHDEEEKVLGIVDVERYVDVGKGKYECKDQGKQCRLLKEIKKEIMQEYEEFGYECNLARTLENENDETLHDSKEFVNFTFDQNIHFNKNMNIEKETKPRKQNESKRIVNGQLKDQNITDFVCLHAKDDQFKCEHCEEKFIDSNNLLEHLIIHAQERKYEVKLIKEDLRKFNGDIVDLIVNMGEKPYECKHCGKRFTRNGDLKRHTMIHTGENPYECKQCGVKFTYSRNLKEHLRIHRKKRSNECEHCKMKFTQSSSLKTHLLIHTGERPHKCNYCGKRFTQRGDLQGHLRLHTGERPYECEQCGKKFALGGNLKKHLKVHTGKGLYECEQCKIKFTQSESFKNHLLIHTGKRLYECKYCEKSFTERGDLQGHLKKHTGERPYECTQCGQKFSRSGNLKEHLKRHREERPYKCTYCEKRFSQRESLKRHLGIHTGERPWECGHCEMKFIIRADLQKHLRIHTGSLKKHLRIHTKEEGRIVYTVFLKEIYTD